MSACATELSEKELDDFDFRHDHTNEGEESFCCPHCLENAKLGFVGCTPKKVTCPLCDEAFIAWNSEVPVCRSAKL